jgi:hypothetical protein
MTKTIHTYSADISGPLTLYVWGELLMRHTTFYIEPAEGQWTVGAAKDYVEESVRTGHAVQIQNKSGKVVFRAEKGHVGFPLDQKRFWEGAGR